MRRTGSQVGGHHCRGALLDDATFLDDQETVGHDHGLEGVMGDDQDRAGELVEVAAQLSAHIQTGPGVQRGQWFVQEQEAGLGGQGSGQGDLLSLPAGDLVGAPGSKLAQVESLQPRVGGRSSRPAAGALDPGGVGDVVANVQVREQAVVLEDQAHRAAFGGHERVGRGVVQDEPAEADGAAAERIQPGQCPKQCALAGSVRTQDGQDLARSSDEVGSQGEVAALHGARHDQGVAAVVRCRLGAGAVVLARGGNGVTGGRRHGVVPVLSHRLRRPARTAIDTTSRTRDRATAASGLLSSAT